MAVISSAIQTFKSFISLGPEKPSEADASSQPKFACPVCDQTMELRDVRPIEKFGLKDVRVHALKCDTCGMLADRIYHPSIGYDHNFVL